MTSRAKAVRPAGTDGTDHEYRMSVDSRYQQLARQRKLLTMITLYLSTAVIAQSVWRVCSYLFKGSTPAMEAMAHLAWAVFRTSLVVYGLGFGKPQKEIVSVLQGYQSLHLLYLIQAVRDTCIQVLLLRNKIAAGEQPSWDGMLDITHPSTGPNMFLLSLDVAEVVLIAASYFCVRNYVALKSTKPKDA